MMKKYIGIDIGGTAIKAGIIDEKGQVLSKFQERSNVDNYQVPLIDLVKKVVGEVHQYAIINNFAPEGVGVSAAGQIDHKKGTVIGDCGNIPGWTGSHLKDEIGKIVNLNVTVENDANCAALAEHWIGNGQGLKNVIVYTIGTGIGAGIILEGKLFSGGIGIAGEIGHMVLQKDGKKCTCGNRGCFEQYGSMTALIRDVSKETGEQLGEIDGQMIFAEARKGNKKVAFCIDRFLEYNATAIVNLLHVFNPEAIIIGGGVSRQGEVILKPLNEKVRKKAMPTFLNNLVIRTAKFTNDAGIIGAVRNFILLQN